MECARGALSIVAALPSDRAVRANRPTTGQPSDAALEPPAAIATVFVLPYPCAHRSASPPAASTVAAAAVTSTTFPAPAASSDSASAAAATVGAAATRAAAATYVAGTALTALP